MSQFGNTNAGRFLTIGQVAALTGVGRSTIRHWEREFQDFLRSVRTDGNQRRFPADSVDKIEKIKGLVEDHGLTLRGVRTRLEKPKPQTEPEKPDPEIEADDNLKKLADLMSEHLVRRLFQESK